jgi:antitoxin MazE
MEVVVARWGNSLAIRLPAESARKIGVTEGDRLIAEVSADGRLVLEREGRALGREQTRRLRQYISRQKQTTPVVADMREKARY